MELSIPTPERELINRAVEHMVAGDEELGRHSARIALILDGTDHGAGSTLRIVAARLEVVRARLQATRELLTEVLVRANGIAKRASEHSS